ncbi:hypothetical protein [Bacillus sp. UMB0728]|uniref:hypothetical protein n=1 Tax=Bacillus sp. UMB0728 TaxID=2066052 RepID=UPI002152E16E|nr:hypothetical protein [Bacillus sp. UMB0728]
MARSVKTDSEIPRKSCLKCEKVKAMNRDFYVSDSPNHADKRHPICKQCVKETLQLDDPMSTLSIDSVKNVLLEMNRPFIQSLWITSVEESNKTGKDLFGLYMKNVFQNFRSLTWRESEFVEKTTGSNAAETKQIVVATPLPKSDEVLEAENKNREDVLRMIGYDPFEYENLEDRRHLYNKLVDFLDESALEDGFKLQACIEIVKGFNQIDRINMAITSLTTDIDKMSNSSGGIKTLIDSKQKILSSLLKLAEDNGISVKHNNQKSKGAGTLTGIIKTLQEKGFEQGEVNLFDIETSLGMRQVADLSNKSIFAQLQFDENDYTQMILEQREIIQELEAKASKFEEENRLLKKELLKYRKQEGDNNE